MLVSALASFTNAQIYFNLETDSFSTNRLLDKKEIEADEKPLYKIHEHKESHNDKGAPWLNHRYDVLSDHDFDQMRLDDGPKHFKEVHRPGETYHYDSFGDHYHHMWPTSDF